MDTKVMNGSFPIKIGNNEYKASRFSDIDIADLDGYIKARYVADAQKAASLLGEEGKSIVKLAMEEIHKTDTNIGWGTEEGSNILATIDGTLHVGYQMALKRHPKLTFKQFEDDAKTDLVSSLNSIIEAWSFFYPNSDSEEDVGGSSTENQKS